MEAKKRKKSGHEFRKDKRLKELNKSAKECCKITSFCFKPQLNANQTFENCPQSSNQETVSELISSENSDCCIHESSINDGHSKVEEEPSTSATRHTEQELNNSLSTFQSSEKNYRRKFHLRMKKIILKGQ